MVRTCLSCGHQTDEDVVVCPIDGTMLRQLASDPMIGTTFLEKYEVTELLGKGGMSAVYKARHVLMDRWVAIKVLRQELVDDGLSLRRFQQESKAVSLLKHPNVMTVHDFGLTPDGIPYLIMDYLEGKTLSQIIKSEGGLHPARCVFLFSQACDALAHAHSKGVVHRDLKPSNLMVLVEEDEVETLKLVDFGIAKLLEMSKNMPQLTTTGEIFGSPYYMSPEQCNGRATDARSDIYSLGCCIFEGLTGTVPFKGETAIETICKHISDTPPMLAEARPDLTLPDELEAVVMKALAKDPDERFQTMLEFDEQLRGAFPDFVNHVTVSRAKPSLMLAKISTTNVNAVARDERLLGDDRSRAKNAEETVTCPSCNGEYTKGLAFCVFCGESSGSTGTVTKTRACPKCGFSNDDQAEFCISCGAGKTDAVVKRKPDNRLTVTAIGVTAIIATGAAAWWMSLSVEKPKPAGQPWITVEPKVYRIDKNAPAEHPTGIWKGLSEGETVTESDLVTLKLKDNIPCYFAVIFQQNGAERADLLQPLDVQYFRSEENALVVAPPREGSHPPGNSTVKSSEHACPKLVRIEKDRAPVFEPLKLVGKPGTDRVYLIASKGQELSWLYKPETGKQQDAVDLVVENAKKYLGETKYPNGVLISEKAIGERYFHSMNPPQELYVTVFGIKHE